ncbi:hypothetical protein B0H15DRAFT_860422 [Mycena belliarum]|uniref:Uncharacterized protein n=1 Tax=Mycena belliarum TaxID=1033014 RepID=A0AAD6TW40_9AGAR|nr:hypothetical protein B0H15DRAFT_860422 [Mycena belliae]
MASLFQYSGNTRDPNEIAAIDFLRKMNIVFRQNGITTDADKFLEVADRFNYASPADQWFEAIKADTTNPALSTDWDAFCTAFKARFEGPAPIVKPRGQLEDELTCMQITMEELARGTVKFGGADVCVLADFVDRVRRAVVQIEAGKGGCGLGVFYHTLPAVLQEGVGSVVPESWDAMTQGLASVPQYKIKFAVSQYRAQASLEARLSELDHQLAALDYGDGPRPLAW